ncbi:MAG: orotate phosphoribosyltransferase [Thermoplasmata archaeon]|nr:MAG: orotate phosphoribosyltransferase [Thermoplasmata archaeon]
MEVMGICAICGKPGIMHTCGLCGRNVCSEHFDAAHSICAECRAKINKQKWDIPP